MALRLRNTESGQMEAFTPLGETVKMYVCGMTPKNHPHMGHARHFVVQDVLRRYLEHVGYRVTYVQNFTDVDDKIIARAGKEGLTAAEVARKYTDSYFRGIERLNVRPADIYPYATHFMPQIIEMVRGLMDRGYAYEAEGTVYFRISRWPTYGRLSGRTEEDNLAGARIEIEPNKEDPRDFALWKAAKPGEPAWPSPWGDGRPGWHIECSAMILHTLGEQIDIHGGGRDLIFPHHENEICQTEAFTGRTPFVRYWVHTGLLTTSGAKMAHSTLNFTTLNDVLERYSGNQIRAYFLAHHYRISIDFSIENLDTHAQGWQRIQNAHNGLLRLLAWPPVGNQPDLTEPPARHDLPSAHQTLVDQMANSRDLFTAAMDDDLNTPLALSHLFDLTRAINGARDATNDPASVTPAVAWALRQARSTLEDLAGILGLVFETPTVEADPQAAAIEALIQERKLARSEKRWADADAIRQRLDGEFGVLIEDTAQGATWRRKS